VAGIDEEAAVGSLIVSSPMADAVTYKCISKIFSIVVLAIKRCVIRSSSLLPQGDHAYQAR